MGQCESHKRTQTISTLKFVRPSDVVLRRKRRKVSNQQPLKLTPEKTEWI